MTVFIRAGTAAFVFSLIWVSGASTVAAGPLTCQSALTQIKQLDSELQAVGGCPAKTPSQSKIPTPEPESPATAAQACIPDAKKIDAWWSANQTQYDALLNEIATCDPSPTPRPAADILTQHGDNFRSGAQLNETALRPSLVRQFGMALRYPPVEVKGNIDAQPLYARGVSHPKGAADSIFVVTGSNWVYCINAATGKVIWNHQLKDPQSSKRSLPNDNPPTPVIDRAQNALYVIHSFANYRAPDPDSPINASTVQSLLQKLDVAFWLTEIDIQTGKERQHVKIQASASTLVGSIVTFDARVQESHPAMLLDHGSLFVGFGSDAGWEGLTDYHGWVMRYDQKTLKQLGVFCTSCGGANVADDGGGVWQGGGGLAADAAGNVYFMVGNAPSSVSGRAYGDSFVKLSSASGGLRLSGVYTVPEASKMNTHDLDLGSGGLVIVPGTSILVGGGKTGMLYAVDGQKMTPLGVNALTDSIQAFTNTYHPGGAWDYGCPMTTPPDRANAGCEDWESGPHLHGSPVYWNGAVLDSSEKDHMKIIPFNPNGGQFGAVSAVGAIRATRMMMPGGLSFLSANGSDTSSAILWSTLISSGRSLLMAYNPATLDLIWQQQFPASAPSSSHRGGPAVADGMLMVPTMSSALLVYALGKTNQGPITQIQPVDAPMMESMSMQADRFSQAARKMDRVEPPEDEEPVFRVRAAIAGDQEIFDGGHRSDLTWSLDDGSAVTGAVVKSVTGPAPSAPAWQLYKVRSSTGTGRLSKINYIERIDTTSNGATYIFFAESAAHP